MKTVFLKFFLILLIAIFFLWWLDVFFTSNVLNSTALTPNKIERLIGNTPSDEIAIFGNSRATKGYLVDSITPKAYNYGMPNENFDIIEFLLQYELKKNSVAPIIIDVHDYFYQHDSYFNVNIETYVPFVKDNIEVENFLKQNNRYHPYYSIVGLRYFGLYTVYTNILISKFMGWDKKIYSKGSIFENATHNKETFKKRVTKRLSDQRTFVVEKEKEKRFTNFFKQHPERKFILVMSPYHYSLKQSVTNFDETENYFKNLSITYPNVEFLFFDGSTYPDRFFKDTIHLNILGSAKFSKDLKIELTKRKLI